jgi:hypothetical protein
MKKLKLEITYTKIQQWMKKRKNQLKKSGIWMNLLDMILKIRENSIWLYLECGRLLTK